jgi:hypothetical protein
MRDIWEQSTALAAWKTVTLMDFDECGLYAHCCYCNHCPGMAMAETGDLLAVPKTCCTVARARMELGIEVAEGQLQTAGAASVFGFDGSIRLPLCPAPTRSVEAFSGDPRGLSGDEFATRMRRIRTEGNPRRRGLVPERGSPADENVKERDLDRASRLRELGR